MKKVILALVFLCINRLHLFAGTEPAGQQLLTIATHQASLFHDRTSPLELEVDLVAQMNVPPKGHLILKWKEKNQWWRKVVIGKLRANRYAER